MISSKTESLILSEILSYHSFTTIQAQKANKCQLILHHFRCCYWYYGIILYFYLINENLSNEMRMSHFQLFSFTYFSNEYAYTCMYMKTCTLPVEHYLFLLFFFFILNETCVRNRIFFYNLLNRYRF
jgi:hypothetical protein